MNGHENDMYNITISIDQISLKVLNEDLTFGLLK